MDTCTKKGCGPKAKVIFRDGDEYKIVLLDEFSVDECAEWLEVEVIGSSESFNTGTEHTACIIKSIPVDVAIIEFLDYNGESKTFSGKFSELVESDTTVYSTYEML